MSETLEHSLDLEVLQNALTGMPAIHHMTSTTESWQDPDADPKALKADAHAPRPLPDAHYTWFDHAHHVYDYQYVIGMRVCMCGSNILF